MIYVEEKDLVVPGEVLAEEDYFSGKGTFKENGKICSVLTGLVSIRNNKISVIPLKSKYTPKRGDVVIGKVDDIRFSIWDVGLYSPYSGILPASEVFGREKKELSRVFDIGDTLFLKVVDVDEVKKVKLGLKGRGLGKFRGGILVHITPTKVPRLIGKRGSMINMIKDKTQCKIVVGQNGVVWVRGTPKMERMVEKIINLIEDEAHTLGLTDRVKEQLYLLVDGEIPENVNEESNFDNGDDSSNSYDDTDNNVNVNNDISRVNESNPEVIYPNNNNDNKVSDLENFEDSEGFSSDANDFNASSSSSKPFNFNLGKRKPTPSVCTSYRDNSSDNKNSKNNNPNNKNQNNMNSNNRNTHKKDFYNINSNNKKRTNVEFDEDGLEKPTLQNITD